MAGEKPTLIFLMLVGIQGSAAVTHSLKYFYTASSGLSDFPSYVSVGFVDDVQISYCDSNINRAIPKQEWMNEVSSDHPNYWKEETQTCLDKQETFKINLEIAKQRYNQTGGVHVFQQMYGCEWDNETGEVSGYDQFGYDGEDFIALNPWTQEWIAPQPQAVITKHKWDQDRYAVEHEQFYLTRICVEWLKKYVKYGRSSLMKTVLPLVSLLQKSSSSPVTCHTTGFYPNRAELFWRTDGYEIHDGVEKGEILPNHDGTFQMSAHIDLSSVPPEHWTRFECVFQLYGVRKDIVTRLEKNKILTNEDNSTFLPFIIVSVTFVIIAVTGLIFCLHITKTGRIPAGNIKILASSSVISPLTGNSSANTKGTSPSDKSLLQHKQNLNK